MLGCLPRYSCWYIHSSVVKVVWLYMGIIHPSLSIPDIHPLDGWGCSNENSHRLNLILTSWSQVGLDIAASHHEGVPLVSAQTRYPWSQNQVHSCSTGNILVLSPPILPSHVICLPLLARIKFHRTFLPRYQPKPLRRWFVSSLEEYMMWYYGGIIKINSNHPKTRGIRLCLDQLRPTRQRPAEKR